MRLACLLFASAAMVSAQAPAGDAPRGKDLFLKYSCYACHGFSGQNGPGARLVPMKFPQAAFIAYVRNPPRPAIMPSYSAKVLTDAAMADLYAYIKSMPDSSPAAKDVPLLNQIQNQK